jgi:hypothetical protein
MLLLKNRGTSLAETVVSITIISIALLNIMAAFYQVSKSPKSDTMQQALNIGNYYLIQIIRKDFPTTLPCPAPPGNRSNYTNICDYNNLVDVGARRRNGNLINGLADYTISVNLTTSTDAILDNLTGGNTAATAQVVRIDVTVARVGIPDIVVTGYRGNY